MRKLKIQGRHEGGKSAKGRQRVSDILHAARDIFVEEGYHSLTMRGVAARCGMTVGNISYYFPNKQALLHDLCDAVVQGYADDWDEIMADPALSPEEQFTSVLRFIMEDLQTKETTNFFPGLWTWANYDKVAAEGLEDVYGKEQAVFVELIDRIRPDLSDEEKALLAVYISASIEGLTIFIGYKKQWLPKGREIINVAAKTFLDLVRDVTAEDIYGGLEPKILKRPAVG